MSENKAASIRAKLKNISNMRSCDDFKCYFNKIGKNWKIDLSKTLEFYSCRFLIAQQSSIHTEMANYRKTSYSGLKFATKSFTLFLFKISAYPSAYNSAEYPIYPLFTIKSRALFYKKIKAAVFIQLP